MDKYKRFIKMVGIGLALAAGLLPGIVSAETINYQQTIENLMQQVADLQQQLLRIQQSQTNTAPIPTIATDNNQPGDEAPFSRAISFNRDLYFGMLNNADVSNLQEFLTDQGFYQNIITGNYFLLTQAAVTKFQASNGVRATGYFGPITRGIANKILAEKMGDVPRSFVSETVKCIFNGSSSEQKCYTATDAGDFYYNRGCSGVGSCGISIKGYTGDKINWKGSCGHAYTYTTTTVDGQNKYVYFNCSAPVQPSITALSPNRGPVGAQIVIHGVNFVKQNTGRNQVKFGTGFINNIFSSNGTEITFTVPVAPFYCDYLISNYNADCAISPPLPATTPGVYPVSVRNENGESNAIDFTVTSPPKPSDTSPPQPSDAVLSPNGGEVWHPEERQLIQWKGLGPAVQVLLFPWSAKTTSGTTYSPIATITASASGEQYLWVVPQNIPDGQYFVRVFCISSGKCGLNALDDSDAPFSIVGNNISNLPPVISGVSGPTSLQVGENGTWTINANDPENGPLSYKVFWGDEAIKPIPALAAPSPSEPVRQTTTFTHSFARAGLYGSLFQVRDSSGRLAETNISVNVGETSAPSITLLSPNGGEIFKKGNDAFSGDSLEIKFEIKNITLSGDYSIYIASRNDSNFRSGTNYYIGGASGVTYVGNSSVTTRINSNFLTGNYYAVVEWKDKGSGASYNFSNSPFSIVTAGTQPSITVLSPNGGERWITSGAYAIKWTSQNIPTDAYVTVQFINGSNVIVARYSGKNSGILQFEALNLPVGDNYKVGILYPDALDYSDAPFSIVGATPASLIIGVSINRVPATVIAGAIDVPFINLGLDATQSNEDIRISTLSMNLTSSQPSSLINCKFSDAAAGLSLTINPLQQGAYNFNFNPGYIIPRGSIKTLSLKCGIPNGALAGSTHKWGTLATGQGATGATTGVQVVPSVSVTNGQLMTVASSGTLSVNLDASSPGARLIPGGSKNAVLTILRLSAVNEDIALKAITLKFNGSNVNALDGKKFSVWDGTVTTKLADGIFPDDANVPITVSIPGSIIIPKDGSKTLTLQGDLALVNVAPTVYAGNTVSIDYGGGSSPYSTYTYGVGQTCGCAIFPLGSPNTSAPKETLTYPNTALQPGSNLASIFSAMSVQLDTIANQLKALQER